MLNFFNNSNIFIWIEKLINFINSIFFVLLLAALSFALIFSPPDYLQGDSVRIMYVHVPAAWIGLSSFTFLALLSILNFIFKVKNFTLVTKSVAPIGLMFTCLAIVTGSLWGQPTWGTFWTWDARLTSMLVLVILYIIYIVIWKINLKFNLAEKLTSIVSLIGLANLPIIKFSVEWWNTLHQPATIKLTESSSIHSSMLTPLLIMFIAFLSFSIIIFLIRFKLESLNLKINSKR